MSDAPKWVAGSPSEVLRTIEADPAKDWPMERVREALAPFLNAEGERGPRQRFTINLCLSRLGTIYAEFPVYHGPAPLGRAPWWSALTDATNAIQREHAKAVKAEPETARQAARVRAREEAQRRAGWRLRPEPELTP